MLFSEYWCADHEMSCPMRVRTTRLTISKRLSTPGGVRVLYELNRRYPALAQAAIPALTSRQPVPCDPRVRPLP